MGKIETTCSYCGVTVYRHKYEIKRLKNTFCCNEHRKLWLSKNLKGRKIERKPSVTCVCNYCKEEFVIKYSKYKNGNVKFCSLKCKQQYNAENHTRILHTCAWCGESIEVSADRDSRCNLHFCNNDCYLKYKQMQHELGMSGKVKKVCPVCGNEFEKWVSMTRHVHNNFCSPKCRDIWRSEHYSYYVSLDKSKGDVKYLSPKNKEMVREFFGRRCCICNKHENENMRKLSVHHVYPEEVNVKFNDTYFIAVCDVCHKHIHSDVELLMNVISDVESRLFYYKGSFIKAVVGSFYGRTNT